MGIENRPYVGSWRLGQKKIVQHTPDALVYINGDLAVPGCQKCNGRIDIQRFVTEVSVDAGVEMQGATANFSLSVPVHGNESFVRDAKVILKAGLEVHVYKRGYFPIKGLFSNLSAPVDQNTIVTSSQGDVVFPTAENLQGGFSKNLSSIDFSKVPQGFINKWLKQNPNSALGFDQMSGDNWKRAVITMAVAEATEQYWRQKYPDAKVNISDHARFGADTAGNHKEGAAMDYYITYNNGQNTVPALQAWGGSKKLADAGKVPTGGQGLYINAPTMKGCLPEQQGAPSSKFGSPPGGSSGTHYDLRGNYDFKTNETSASTWVQINTGRGQGNEFKNDSAGAVAWLRNNGLSCAASYYNGGWQQDGWTPEVENVPHILQILGQVPTVGEAEQITMDSEQIPRSDKDIVRLPKKLQGADVANVLAYPYYHVFRGVIIQVGVSYSGGVQNISVQCASMLHFWQFQQICTNASIFGSRPENAGLKTSVLGHNLTGKQPYEIVYFLYSNTVGDAAGVAWALAQKTNVDSRSVTALESHYSLVQKYWEKRFNSKEIRLRMHGATGRLFSAYEAALYGRLDTQQLTAVMQKRFGVTQSSGDVAVMSATTAKAVTNTEQAKAIENEDLQFTQKGATHDGQAWNTSMADMQAFVSDIGKWGDFQLFETTYESKQDVMNKVLDVTGWEFYQDVDGDFVFKPPMYNLDTSSSRVYRIEDIDIISITFEEKEPQVTYMTARNPGMMNLEGTGLEGEYGVKGFFADWKLVAQFGWRPGSLETAYLANPMALYYGMMSRMAVLNAPMTTATVTVPLRPEIRPGYPVYIPYLDCFYYCTSISHSFSVGGQCSTTLQLVARRAKFYAPGAVTERGIEAINLANPELPQKPLEVLDLAGRPRLSGFPNVVMALDPKKMNPLYMLTGTNMDNIADPTVLNNIVQAALQLHIIRQKESEPGVYLITLDDDRVIELVFNSSLDQTARDAGESTAQAQANMADLQRRVGGGFDFTVGGAADTVAVRKDLQAIAKEYAARRASLNQQIATEKNSQKELQTQIREKEKAKNALDPRKESDKTAIDQANQEINNLREQYALSKAQIEASRSDFELSLNGEEKVGVKYLIDMIKRLGGMFGVDISRGWKGAEFSSTATLLDLIASKKNALGLEMVGDFRYYSASHPKKDQQGMPAVTLTVGDDGTSASTTTEAPKLTTQNQIEGYIPSDRIGHPLGARAPEAQIAPMTPEWGIKVLTSTVDKEAIIPTSDVKELRFAVHELKHSRKVVNTKKKQTARNVEGSLRSSLGVNATRGVGSPSTSSTIEDVMKAWFSTFTTNVQSASDKAKEALSGASQLVPSYPAIPAPVGVVVGGTGLSVTEAIVAKYKFSDSPNTSATTPEAYPGSSRDSVAQFWNKAATAYANRVFDSWTENKEPWFAQMRSNGLGQAQAQAAMDAFSEAMANAYGALVVYSDATKDRLSKPAPKATKYYSPVFPVSDGRGYEVFGNFRYGRGLTIDADGALDILHKQDPTKMLDRDTVEKMVDTISRGVPIMADLPVGTSPTGAAITESKKVSGGAALNALEQEVGRQVVGKVSDQMLIDMGLVTQNKDDPTLLEMNLMNWYSTKGKDGIQKLPINNAAYSLADLNTESSRHICSCKLAEAEIMLDAAQQGDFVQFSGASGTTIPQGSTDDMDMPTRWSVTQIAKKMPEWVQMQDAMRGTASDKAGSSLVSVIKGMVDPPDGTLGVFDQVKKSLSVQADAITTARQKAAKQFGDIKNGNFNTEDDNG